MFYKLLIGLILSCCFFNTSVFAQIRPDVVYHFAIDTINVQPGVTFGNSLQITNFSNKAILLTQSDNATHLPAGLLNLPDSIVLSPGQHRTYAVKYIADKYTITSNIQPFKLFLTSAEKDITASPSANFVSRITENNDLIVGLDEPEVYFNPATGQAQFNIHCINPGLGALSFSLVASSSTPDMEIIAPQQIIELGSSERRTFTFIVRVNKKLRSSGDERVLVTAVGANGRTLSALTVRLVAIGSDRRIGGNNYLFSPAYSKISGFRYIKFGENFSTYEMWGQGLINDIGKTTLNYSYNIDYYQQQRTLGIYNTTLNYQQKKWGLKAGNVNENLDLPLNGRGVVGTARFDENREVNMYLVQNQFMLFNGLINSAPAPTTLAASYQYTRSARNNYRILFATTSNPYFGLDQRQLSGFFNTTSGENIAISLEGGLSLEGYRDASRPSQKGFALGANYNLEKKKYSLSLNNYYASPYYTGLRRGLIQSQSRFSIRTSNNSLFSVSANIYSNRAATPYQTDDVFFRRNQKNTVNTFQLGFNTVSRRINWGISPYFMYQSLQGVSIFDINGTNKQWSSSAARLSATLSFNANANTFSLNTDYGYVFKNSSGRVTSPFHSMRINANWSNRYVGVMGFVQLNPFYLTDLISLSPEGKYTQYSVGPNIHFTTLQNKFTLQGNIMYNYYSVSRTKNLSTNINMQYALRGNYVLTADIFSSKVSQYGIYDPVNNAQLPESRFSTSQLRLGVEKRFGRSINNNGKTLELAYYDDANNNGVKDKNESSIGGVMVSLNGEVAQTNDKGVVKFTNLRPESYSVNITNNQGWTMADPLTILMAHNQKFTVPLVKTKPIKGMLIAEKGFDQNVLNLSGVNIVAENNNGKIYNTLTDERGQFCFYLPQGFYTITVNTVKLPFSVSDQPQKVDTEHGENEMIIFKCKDSRRRVLVSEF